jgi:hypothetical protein
VATIRQRKGQWQAQVRLAGFGAFSRTFDKYADAKAWGLEQERKLKLGDVPTERRKELQGVTLNSLIEWYRQDALSAQAQGQLRQRRRCPAGFSKS